MCTCGNAACTAQNASRLCSRSCRACPASGEYRIQHMLVRPSGPRPSLATLDPRQCMGAAARFLLTHFKTPDFVSGRGEFLLGFYDFVFCWGNYFNYEIWRRHGILHHRGPHWLSPYRSPYLLYIHFTIDLVCTSVGRFFRMMLEHFG